MYTKVLIADPIVLNNPDSKRIAQDIVEAMGGVFFEGPIPDDYKIPPGKTTVFSYQPNLTPAQIDEELNNGYTGVIVAAKAVTNPKVKFAVRIGAGVNNVAAIEKAGGVIMNMPGFNSQPTSEAILYALNSVLSPDPLKESETFVLTDLVRQTRETMERTNKRSDSDNLSGNYHSGWPEFKGTPPAKNKRICFVGASGHIGGLTAEALAADGYDVVGVSRNPEKAAAERPLIKEWTKDILAAAKDADVIVIQIPENDATKKIITEEIMRAAKKGVVIVNAARAGVIDTDALKKLTDEEHIGGLITDLDHFTTGKKESPSEPYIQVAEILQAQGKKAIIAPHTFADTHSPSRELGGMQAIRQALRAVAIQFGITKEPYINRASVLNVQYPSTKEDGLKPETLHPTIVKSGNENLAAARAEANRSKVFDGRMPC